MLDPPASAHTPEATPVCLLLLLNLGLPDPEFTVLDNFGVGVRGRDEFRIFQVRLDL